jgi:hypothetical protein
MIPRADGTTRPFSGKTTAASGGTGGRPGRHAAPCNGVQPRDTDALRHAGAGAIGVGFPDRADGAPTRTEL